MQSCSKQKWQALKGVLAATALSLFLLLGFWLPAWGAGTCNNFVNNTGFEDEINYYWVDSSTNFGFLICDAGCSINNTNHARTGAWWAWFGGTDGTVLEEGTLQQSITIPERTTEGIVPLQFYLWTQEIGTSPTDFIRVLLDGNILFSTLASNPDYKDVYVPVTLNISAYADGGSHTLRFESTINSTTSFFIDDVSRPDLKFVNFSKLVNFADDLLQPVIDTTLPVQEIRAQAYDSREDIVVNLENTAVLALKGGFGCDFAEIIPDAKTTIRSLEIRSGKVIAQNLVLKGNNL